MRTIEEMAEAVYKALVGYALEVSHEEFSWINQCVLESEGMFELTMWTLLSKCFDDFPWGETIQLIIHVMLPIDPVVMIDFKVSSNYDEIRP